MTKEQLQELCEKYSKLNWEIDLEGDGEYYCANTTIGQTFFIRLYVEPESCLINAGVSLDGGVHDIDSVFFEAFRSWDPDQGKDGIQEAKLLLDQGIDAIRQEVWNVFVKTSPN